MKKILPYISPWGMIGFHYTIIVIFISKGHQFIRNIGSAFLCFIPLTLYFIITWFSSFFLVRFLTNRMQRNKKYVTEEEFSDSDYCGCEKEYLLAGKAYGKNTCGASYAVTMTQCFTTASNNFELSLAVSISLYGNRSKQAIAATFGPLLEIPILLALAYFAKYLEHAFVWSDIKKESSTNADNSDIQTQIDITDLGATAKI
ncbi:hypothetical protein TPHA_0O00110 [Tetrapisispora phaffii CBS 4417]|uniref:Uncharacterized protein n=1 Tax=Tetrapisispora phaffii (strain ATCC 24235 / CBS 4417 / NBRC 1672 / NRRL Y-8282 / UCD 70-5) TaxID=1071381 RepID=G8C1F5_TETPH|nr:hypothetical protein TPHA_0O00110 [Tetrapisispora phaffii CBS 4417]CCE65983.1 hypothetical protein TPHA_0O00110 [Tetrapisispora phaffii CBS 4417]